MTISSRTAPSALPAPRSTSPTLTSAPERRWLDEAADVCKSATRGDLESRILNIDEAEHADPAMPDLLHAINHLLDMTDAFVREATASLEFAGEGKFFRRVLLAGMQGSFARASISINAATSQMHTEQQAISHAEAERLALENDFSRVRAVVNELSAASSQIDIMSKTIGKLASQTSLLSINASIEAARVGELGRGFGVVASEVKKLATQAAGASTDIQQRVRDLATATAHTASTIDQIWEVIRRQSQHATTARDAATASSSCVT